MENDAVFTIVMKITLVTGETRRHSYTDCPQTKDGLTRWWQEEMRNVFSEAGLRLWVKLKNPHVFYNTAHIAAWEFECTGPDECKAQLEEMADRMLLRVGRP